MRKELRKINFRFISHFLWEQGLRECDYSRLNRFQREYPLETLEGIDVPFRKIPFGVPFRALWPKGIAI